MNNLNLQLNFQIRIMTLIALFTVKRRESFIKTHYPMTDSLPEGIYRSYDYKFLLPSLTTRMHRFLNNERGIQQGNALVTCAFGP